MKSLVHTRMNTYFTHPCFFSTFLFSFRLHTMPLSCLIVFYGSDNWLSSARNNENISFRLLSLDDVSFFFHVRRPELPFTFFCPFTNERWEYLRINDGKKWGVCLASRSGVFLTQLDCHFTGFFFLGRLPLLPSWSFRSRYYLIIYLPSSDWFFLFLSSTLEVFFSFFFNTFDYSLPPIETLEKLYHYWPHSCFLWTLMQVVFLC